MRRALIASLVLIAALALLAFIIPLVYHPHHHDPTREARLNLRKIADGARAYYAQEFASSSGDPLPHQLPESVAETPAEPRERFCDDGDPRPRPPTPADWAHPTWRALRFAVDDPHRYAYSYTRDVDGRGFIARARGDLDCDGILEGYEHRGALAEDGELHLEPLQVYPPR